MFKTILTAIIGFGLLWLALLAEVARADVLSVIDTGWRIYSAVSFGYELHQRLSQPAPKAPPAPVAAPAPPRDEVVAEVPCQYRHVRRGSTGLVEVVLLDCTREERMALVEEQAMSFLIEQEQRRVR